MLESLFDKVAGLQDSNNIAKDSGLHEYRDIFKSTYFENYFRTASSIVRFVSLVIKSFFDRELQAKAVAQSCSEHFHKIIQKKTGDREYFFSKIGDLKPSTF